MFDYTAPPKLLHNKTILITGANRGIGRAAAIAYASAGATVILLGRDIESLEQVYDEIIALGAPTPAILPFNLQGASDAALNELADVIHTNYGKLDGLLNNASLLGFKGALRDTETTQWQQTLDVNLTASFTLTRTLLPLLEAAPNASVIFTSSGVGRKGRAYWGAYAVSKFGIEALTQIFADEMENTSNIRFNAINPGGTDTLMRRAAYPGEDPRTLPKPEDIMPLYLYLMGDDSASVNGQSLDARG